MAEEPPVELVAEDDSVFSDHDPSSVASGTHQLTIAVVVSGVDVKFGVHQGAVPTVGGHASVEDSVDTLGSEDVSHQRSSVQDGSSVLGGVHQLTCVNNNNNQ